MKLDLRRSGNSAELALNRVDNYQLFLKYGYFYYQYNKDTYYYEIFYMFKRVVYLSYNVFLIPLISLHTKYESNITGFINLEILFIWTFFLIHLYQKPFRKELSIVNKLETCSSIIIITSFFFSALFFNDVSKDDQRDDDIRLANYLLYYAIYVANLIFFIFAFRIIYINEKKNVRKFLYDLKNYILCPIRSIYKLVRALAEFFRNPSIQFFYKTKGGVKKKYKVSSENLFELNPLADWDIEKANIKAIPLGKKTAEEIQIKNYRDKIKVLTLINAFQKKEIKRLKNMLRKIKETNAQSEDQDIIGREQVCPKKVNIMPASKRKLNNGESYVAQPLEPAVLI